LLTYYGAKKNKERRRRHKSLKNEYSQTLDIMISFILVFTTKKSAYRGGFEKLKTASIDMNAL
jgi:hypothetical protein